jgi:hypothetical protein
VTKLPAPFVRKHLEENLFEVFQIGRRFKLVGHFATARLLGAGQHRVQQGATGVGVDLDKLRALGSQVEIETQEDAKRSWVDLSDARRPGQRRFPIAARPTTFSTAAIIAAMPLNCSPEMKTAVAEYRCSRVRARFFEPNRWDYVFSTIISRPPFARPAIWRRNPFCFFFLK